MGYKWANIKMKKIISLLVICFTILFVSCNNNDTASSDYSKLIIGYWELVSETEYDNGKAYTGYGEEITLSFYPDNTVSSWEEGYSTNGTWMISDNILFLNMNSYKENYIIKTLNSKQLIIKSPGDYRYIELVFRKI